MIAASVGVTIVTILANASIAIADLARARFVVANSASVGVPETWLTPLGLLKLAGAAGLLLGLLGVPLVGSLAAMGLVMFFVGAVANHVRAGDYSLGFPVSYLLLAAASLVSSVALS